MKRRRLLRRASEDPVRRAANRSWSRSTCFASLRKAISTLSQRTSHSNRSAHRGLLRGGQLRRGDGATIRGVRLLGFVHAIPSATLGAYDFRRLRRAMRTSKMPRLRTRRHIAKSSTTDPVLLTGRGPTNPDLDARHVRLAAWMGNLCQSRTLKFSIELLTNPAHTIIHRAWPKSAAASSS